MAIMLKSGLSMSEAVDLILAETDNPKMKKIMQDLAFSLQEGGEISMILRKYPEVFDDIFLALIRAGEQTGSLEKTFEYLANQIYSTHQLKKKVQGALMYPAVIMTAMVAMGVLMMTFVLPKLSEVFLKMKIELPAPTRIMLAVGNFMGKNAVFVFGSIFVLVITVVFLMKNVVIKKAVVSALANAPLVKKVYKQIDLARFCDTLSSLLRSGVPIVKSLNIASATLTQKKMIEVSKRFEKEITEGKQLGDILESDKDAFPSILVQTIKTGEKTGTLDTILIDVGKYYQEELDSALKQFTSLLEPLIMIIVGLAVGAMVIMVLGPIYGLVGGMQDAGGTGGM
jgi:type IV pilus assembly protein PilC